MSKYDYRYEAVEQPLEDVQAYHVPTYSGELIEDCAAANELLMEVFKGFADVFSKPR